MIKQVQCITRIGWCSKRRRPSRKNMICKGKSKDHEHSYPPGGKAAAKYCRSRVDLIPKGAGAICSKGAKVKAYDSNNQS